MDTRIKIFRLIVFLSAIFLISSCCKKKLETADIELFYRSNFQADCDYELSLTFGVKNICASDTAQYKDFLKNYFINYVADTLYKNKKNSYHVCYVFHSENNREQVNSINPHFVEFYRQEIPNEIIYIQSWDCEKKLKYGYWYLSQAEK